MADPMVLIRNTYGVEYAVYPRTFEREAHTTYKGFHIVAYESGEPYHGPKTTAAVEKAQEHADAPAAPQQGAPRASAGKQKAGE